MIGKTALLFSVVFQVIVREGVAQVVVTKVGGKAVTLRWYRAVVELTHPGSS